MQIFKVLLIILFSLTLSVSQAEENAEIIDLNTATKYELMTLQGVGEKRAEAILKYREQHGLFQSTYEITEVYGIGDKLFEYNEPNMIVTFPKEEVAPLPESTTVTQNSNEASQEAVPENN